MHGFALRRKLSALDSLQRSAGGVQFTAQEIHGLFDTSGGIDAGPLGFIRETDKVRVIESVGILRQEGSLAIFQVHDGGIPGRWHHAGGKHYQVHVYLQLLPQERVFEFHIQASGTIGYADRGPL